MTESDVAIVGAGPIGVELGAALKRASVDYVQFEAGQIAQTIYEFAPQMRFFSSSQRIQLAAIPIQTTDQSKCTREEYLAYLRSLVQQLGLEVRTYERVTEIERIGAKYLLRTQTRSGHEHTHRTAKLVLATGGTSTPRTLGILGEELPHVGHDLDDPHKYFRRRVLVVGGRNSAVEAALRCYHAGADVAISYRNAQFHDRVKYWLKPEVEMLIETGRIDGFMGTIPVAISSDAVTLQRVDSDETIEVPADFVLLMIGYIADMSLFQQVGVELVEPAHAPVYNEQTMETNVPGVYVAGTAVAGTQTTFQVFLENCHVHVDRIVAALIGAAPPPPPTAIAVPET